MKICPRCGTSYDPQQSFCVHCGRALLEVGKICQNCGHQESNESLTFCKKCGNPLINDISMPSLHKNVQMNNGGPLNFFTNKKILFIGGIVVLLTILMIPLIVFDFPHFNFPKSNSYENIVVAETTQRINTDASNIIQTTNIAITLPDGCLSKNTKIKFSELGANEDIATGIFVDFKNSELLDPIPIEFTVDHNLEPGMVVQLLQTESLNEPWKPAVDETGAPVLGFVAKDKKIISVVTHFSGYALPADITNALDDAAHYIIRDVNRYTTSNNSKFYVPNDFNPEAIMNGSHFAGITLLAGLDDEDMRTQRYKEVLAVLFVQADQVELPNSALDMHQEELLKHINYQPQGSDLELIETVERETLQQLFCISTEFRDALRVYRDTPIEWSKHARLDYVANRMNSYIDQIGGALVLAGDISLINKDIYYAALHSSINDALVLDRIAHFESLLLEQENPDPALVKGFQQAKELVEKKLEDRITNFKLILGETFASNIFSYVKIGGHVVIIANEGLIGLSKLHPAMLFIDFLIIYQNDVLNAYADIQRATIAANLFWLLPDITFNAEDNIFEPEEINLTVMRLYMAQYYYKLVSDQYEGSLLSRLAGWLTIIEDNKWKFIRGEDLYDYEIRIEREKYLKSAYGKLLSNYTDAEQARLTLLMTEPQPLIRTDYYRASTYVHEFWRDNKLRDRCTYTDFYRFERMLDEATAEIRVEREVVPELGDCLHLQDESNFVKSMFVNIMTGTGTDDKSNEQFRGQNRPVEMTESIQWGNYASILAEKIPSTWAEEIDEGHEWRIDINRFYDITTGLIIQTNYQGSVYNKSSGESDHTSCYWGNMIYLETNAPLQNYDIASQKVNWDLDKRIPCDLQGHRPVFIGTPASPLLVAPENEKKYCSWSLGDIILEWTGNSIPEDQPRFSFSENVDRNNLMLTNMNIVEIWGKSFDSSEWILFGKTNIFEYSYDNHQGIRLEKNSFINSISKFNSPIIDFRWRVTFINNSFENNISQSDWGYFTYENYFNDDATCGGTANPNPQETTLNLPIMKITGDIIE